MNKELLRLEAENKAESFDAVLAKMRNVANGQRHQRLCGGFMAYIADRLQSAHAAEVAELRKDLTGVVDGNIYAVQRAEQERLRADRAVGLLREIADEQTEEPQAGSLLARIDAFLSEQAGERENATKDSAHED